MNSAVLLWANLLRNKLRLTLMLLMIALAFALLAMFQATDHGLHGDSNARGNEQLLVMNRASASLPLPLRYLTQISAMPEVAAAGYADWFGGYYQSPEHQVPVLAIDEGYLQANPALLVDPTSLTNWRQTRQGLLISQQLADQLGLQVGRQFTLASSIWQRADGGGAQWDFVISGIYQVAPDSAMPATNLLMHYDYLNDVKQLRQNTVGAFAVLLSNASDYPRVVRQIDQLFANSEAETRTVTLAAYAESMLGQLVDLNKVAALILGVVFGTLLLVCASNMANSLRDRRRELALQLVLGFHRGLLVRQLAAEFILLLAMGAALGYLLAFGVVVYLQQYLQAFLPNFGMQWADLLPAMLAVGVMALCVTLLPMRAIGQLSLAEQLKAA